MIERTRLILRTMLSIFLVTLMVGAVPGCSNDDAEEEKKAEAAASEKKGERPPTAVRVATSRRGELTRKIPVTGELLADKLVELAPMESGQLIELMVDEGDRVEAGQVLGRLDKELEKRSRVEASTRVQSARARVAAIEAQMEAQRKEVERRRALVERKAFPAAELQKLEDQLAVLEQNAAVARAERDEARSVLRSQGANIDRRVIKAPFDGIVVTRHVTRGASVGPGSPILTIIDEDSMRFIASVAERRIGAIGDRNPALITLDAYPDRTLNAQVVEIGTLVDRDSRTVDVEMVINDENAILPSQQRKARSAGAEPGVDKADEKPNEKPDEKADEKPDNENMNPGADDGSEKRSSKTTSRADEAAPSPTQPTVVVLRHGMFGRGGIIVDSVDNAVIIPAEALSSGPEGKQVWTVTDGKAETRPVTVLLETETEIAVEGLSEGTSVIVSGTRMLEPGAAVTVSGETRDRSGGPDRGSAGSPAKDKANKDNGDSE